MSEVWRTIPGWPDYEASTLGNVRRIAGPRSRRPRVLRPATMPAGYKIIRPCQNGKPQMAYIHRFVCAAFHGLPPSPTHQAAHLNGIRGDNRPENLAWKTPAENAADMRRHGTARIGERHHNARLDRSSVNALRSAYAAGVPTSCLAEVFNISRHHVWQIVNWVRWAP